jgi:phosphate/sulfate permease
VSRRAWFAVTVIAAGTGVAVAAVMTWLDWRLNPAGIFRDAGGTHWSFVAETFASWFIPVFWAAGIAALAVFALRGWLAGRGGQ